MMGFSRLVSARVSSARKTLSVSDMEGNRSEMHTWESEELEDGEKLIHRQLG